MAFFLEIWRFQTWKPAFSACMLLNFGRNTDLVSCFVSLGDGKPKPNFARRFVDWSFTQPTRWIYHDHFTRWSSSDHKSQIPVIHNYQSQKHFFQQKTKEPPSFTWSRGFKPLRKKVHQQDRPRQTGNFSNANFLDTLRKARVFKHHHLSGQNFKNCFQEHGSEIWLETTIWDIQTHPSN